MNGSNQSNGDASRFIGDEAADVHGRPYEYDLLGVGIGPFNLSLAALLEPERANDENIRPIFLEAKEQFDWHPGMILPGTTLQVPFFADLTTMADPRSAFSFLNYMHETGRLYRFYFYENFKILRKEYNQYCQWVAARLDSLRFGARVTDIRPRDAGGFQVVFQDAKTGDTYGHSALNLALGFGTTPQTPQCVHPHLGRGVCHTAEYANNRAWFRAARRVIVIGSGQSAGECLLDLLQAQLEGGYEIDWFTRSEGFLPMEYSKLGLEHFSPEYIDYFYSLSEKARDRIQGGQSLFYKGMSTDTIAAIYDQLYENQLEPDAPATTFAPRIELIDVQRRAGGALEAHFRHMETGETFSRIADAILLGTGYSHRLPSFLDNLTPHLELDSRGRLQIERDYRVRRKDRKQAGEIFIQNGEIHTHGIGAPDLGLGAYRSAVIVNQLLGREVYRVSEKNVFQTFGFQAPQSVQAATNEGARESL